MEHEWKQYQTTQYAIRGKCVCKLVFAAAVQVKSRTITKYVSVAGQADFIELIETNTRGTEEGARFLAFYDFHIFPQQIW